MDKLQPDNIFVNDRIILELTSVNIVGKRPSISVLTILVGSYNDFGLTSTFGRGPGRPKTVSVLIAKS